MMTRDRVLLELNELVAVMPSVRGPQNYFIVELLEGIMTAVAAEDLTGNTRNDDQPDYIYRLHRQHHPC